MKSFENNFQHSPIQTGGLEGNEKFESEKIIEKLGLKTGQEISLLKKSLNAESTLAVGKVLKGKLTKDVALGLPIEFDTGANTSNLKKITDENGKYLFETMTSVYELAQENPEKNFENITAFESFVTERGSVYKVLENGQVQRFKNILLDESYVGDDKHEAPERAPSDIALFYKRDKIAAGWFDVGATTENDKTIAQSIDIGTYVEDANGNYHLVKNNADFKEPFLFVRVKKSDSFKLEDSLTKKDLLDFQARTYMPENRGLGVIYASEGGAITNIPKVGLNTFDYRYEPSGKVESMHGGNKIISVKEKVANSSKTESKTDTTKKSELVQKPGIVAEAKRQESLTDTERAGAAELNDSFRSLQGDLKYRYENGYTKFFDEDQLRELDSVSVSLSSLSEVQKLKDFADYLPGLFNRILDTTVNSGIKDDHESLNQLSYRIKNLNEKLQDFGNRLMNDGSEKEAIARNLYIGADMAEQLRQKIDRYHQFV